jgi:hypothetical protein
MVASFAAAMFRAGSGAGPGPYRFEKAVEQLTVLWANAVGASKPEVA